MCPFKLQDNNDLDRGKRLLEERKKIWKSRKKFSEETELSFRTLENWENGANIPCDCLREIHEHGGDIVYILTGKRSIPAKELTPQPESEAVDFSDIKTLKDTISKQQKEIEELKKDKEDLRNSKAELRELLDVTKARLLDQGQKSG